MKEEKKNFFLYIMEAETELQSFDGGGDMSTTADPPAMDDSAPPSDDGADNPPDLAMDEGGDGLDAFDGSETSTDMMDSGDDTGDTEEEDGNKDDDSMSKKANDLLNQKLYEQLCARNDEIDKIIESLQTLTPVLSHDFIDENEKHISRLKAALNKSKDYAISKFIDAEYGENLLFFNEINLLFKMLCDELDKNLKKNFKDQK